MIGELARYVLADPYPFVIDLSKSRGMRIRTVDGQELFDWAGYYASKLIGHNPPELMRDKSYREKLFLAAGNKLANPDFLTPECLEYYRLIHSLAPRSMRGKGRPEVYTVNSGAEAIENLMKYFISLHAQKLVRKRKTAQTLRFLYFDQAFHGRTVFALNVTNLSHDPILTKGFSGIVPGNIQVPFPAYAPGEGEDTGVARAKRSLEIVEDALKRYGDEIVGIVVEPIQGAGGHRAAHPEFFRGLSRLAHRYGVNLGFDEVQTAGGQLGSFFAIDQFDLPHPPQAVACAKKLGNGVLYMLDTMDDEGVLDSTWGGSLADMVRFVREMKYVVKHRLIEKVPEKARVLREGLEGLSTRFPKQIFGVRGMGLYQGWSMANGKAKAEFIRRAREEEDLFLLGAGVDSIRLRPVLDVTVPEIRELLKKLERLLALKFA